MEQVHLPHITASPELVAYKVGVSLKTATMMTNVGDLRHALSRLCGNVKQMLRAKGTEYYESHEEEVVRALRYAISVLRDSKRVATGVENEEQTQQRAEGLADIAADISERFRFFSSCITRYRKATGEIR